MDTRKISVIVPCFNEGKRIYRNIGRIWEFLSGRFQSFQIIAVNDGSFDDTATELARAVQIFPSRLSTGNETPERGTRYGRASVPRRVI